MKTVYTEKTLLKFVVCRREYFNTLSDPNLCHFSLRVFFETTEAEKHPGFLCPDYAGFLGITEKYFYDSLTSVLEDPNIDCR